MTIASDFAQDFGALVQKHIDLKGWTHEAVAIAVWGTKGADRKGHVSGYINARRGKPSAATIRGFADALDIPPEEIEALRTKERAAAQAEAQALNIPVAFLDKMAELFGEAEKFQGWDAYASFMAGKAQDHARLRAEVAQLGQDQPATANRLPQIQALLDDGDIAKAEAALADLRPTATDKALAGLQDLSRIMELQGDAALLRGDEDAAFTLYRHACDLFDPVDPQVGADVRYDRAEQLWRHALRFGGHGFVMAADMLRRNIEIWSDADQTVKVAHNQICLGIVLRNQGTRTEGAAGADLLARAVTGYRAALDVTTRRNDPVNWATTQNNLGLALWEQGRRTEGAAGADLLAQAVTAYRTALEVRTRQDHPVDWAVTQNNLGLALDEQGIRTEGTAGADLLAQAVTAYRSALEVHTRHDHPVDWAMTQNNMGNALQEQGIRTQGAAGADLLAQAVTAYRAALEVTTRQDHPVDWAMTQNNLGNALQEQGTRTEGEAGADLLAQAVTAYHAALEVHTRQDHPVQWAESQANLAGVFLEQSRVAETTERPKLLDQALAAIDNALEIFDPDTMSYHYGGATHLREKILAEVGDT